MIEVQWNDIDLKVAELAKLIRLESWMVGRKCVAVVGIQRGGLIPAVMISHELELPFHSVELSTLERDTHIFNKAVRDLITSCSGDEYVLVVDDINDSGKTLMEFERIYSEEGKGMRTYTLHNHNESCFTTTFKSESIDEWVKYPWEKE